MFKAAKQVLIDERNIIGIEVYNSCLKKLNSPNLQAQDYEDIHEQLCKITGTKMEVHQKLNGAIDELKEIEGVLKEVDKKLNPQPASTTPRSTRTTPKP